MDYECQDIGFDIRLVAIHQCLRWRLTEQATRTVGRMSFTYQCLLSAERLFLWWACKDPHELVLSVSHSSQMSHLPNQKARVDYFWPTCRPGECIRTFIFHWICPSFVEVLAISQLPNVSQHSNRKLRKLVQRQLYQADAKCTCHLILTNNQRLCCKRLAFAS